MYDYEAIIEKTKLALAHNIRKFRLTGGEPFTHPRIGDLIRFFSDLDVYLLVNTNASLVESNQQAVRWAGPNVHFAASLDTIDKTRFHRISGTSRYFERVITGIRILAEAGRLLRLNMVVSKYNKCEVFPIISYCRDLRCHLKLLDVVSVPLPYGARDDLHVCLDDVETELARIATKVELHDYARSFGTPCWIYNVDGVQVTVKSTSHGSRYDVAGICAGCPYFPCHEGLYDIFLLADGRLCGCRWSLSSVSTSQGFEEGLEEMIRIFQRATWIDKSRPNAMPPAPEIVMGTGLYADYWARCK